MVSFIFATEKRVNTQNAIIINQSNLRLQLFIGHGDSTEVLVKNWDFINEQIDKTLSVLEQKVKELNKSKTKCKNPNVNVVNYVA